MRIEYFIIFIYIILTFSIQDRVRADDILQLYGSVNPRDYLTGRFNPSKHELFGALSDLGIPTNKSRQYLRREAAEALQNMYAAFRREHPWIPFGVRSSARNFYDQKQIWEGKWSGKIPVMGKRLNRIIKDPLKRAREIMKYSSMPGVSRHHWGTDFDLEVLTNTYYESGEGRLLYQWLAKNSRRYGFCQPYTFGRKNGYCEERWHWSNYPLAKHFLKGWNSLYKKDPAAFSEKGLFPGSSAAGHLAPLYMNAISHDCE